MAGFTFVLAFAEPVAPVVVVRLLEVNVSCTPMDNRLATHERPEKNVTLCNPMAGCPTTGRLSVLTLMLYWRLGSRVAMYSTESATSHALYTSTLLPPCAVVLSDTACGSHEMVATVKSGPMVPFSMRNEVLSGTVKDVIAGMMRVSNPFK